jgi:hypothetical protein
MGHTQTLHSAEMEQTTKLFAIYGRSVVGSTPGYDVDFVQGTDPLRFGIGLHSLWLDGCYAHFEVEKDSVSMFEDSSWIDTVHSFSDASGY